MDGRIEGVATVAGIGCRSLGVGLLMAVLNFLPEYLLCKLVDSKYFLKKFDVRNHNWQGPHFLDTVPMERVL